MRKASAGFSIFGLVIAMLMVTVITGYAIVRLRTSRADLTRMNAAQELAVYLEQAQLDSNRRQTNKVDQMACITVLDNKTYSYMIDENSDGRLDPPKYITLSTENNLRIKGPFPKTFRFDWLGRVVDLGNKLISPPLVVFTNSRGTSTIRLSDGGKPVVIHGPLPGIGVQR